MGYWSSLFGQDGWILAKSVDRDGVEVHKLLTLERANGQKYRNLVGSDLQMQRLAWRNWTQKGWPYGWSEL